MADKLYDTNVLWIPIHNQWMKIQEIIMKIDYIMWNVNQIQVTKMANINNCDRTLFNSRIMRQVATQTNKL